MSAAGTYFDAWVDSESASDDSFQVKRIYVDINDGNLTDGIIFSRIMYWHGKNKDGKSRLRVRKNDQWWLAKGYADWFAECRIKEHAARDAIKRIEDRGLIETNVYRFNGKPMIHIRVIKEAFEKTINDLKEGDNSNSIPTESVETEPTESVETETTDSVETITKTTTKTTQHSSADAEKPEPKKESQESDLVQAKTQEAEKPEDSANSEKPETGQGGVTLHPNMKLTPFSRAIADTYLSYNFKQFLVWSPEELKTLAAIAETFTDEALTTAEDVQAFIDWYKAKHPGLNLPGANKALKYIRRFKDAKQESAAKKAELWSQWK